MTRPENLYRKINSGCDNKKLHKSAKILDVKAKNKLSTY